MSDDPFGDALAAKAGTSDSSADPYGDALARRAKGDTFNTPAPPREVTPALTQIGHTGLDIAGGFVHGIGTLADVVTGTYPGPGSHAEAWTQWAKHDPDYTGPETDPKVLAQQNAPKVDPYKILPEGPLQDEVRARVPQATEAISTVLPFLKGAGLMSDATAATKAASAIEEGHPLTAAAKAEADEMQAHAGAAEAAGVELPPREVTPAQGYVNDAARRDLDLPKNAPVTDGLLDAAKKRVVSPAYDAAKKVPEYDLGEGYKGAIGKVDLEQIDPKYRPPTDGKMTGAQAVDMSGQLRSVARGLYEDAENQNLTYAQRQAARTQAQAHYQAAKAVEGGFREAAGAADAASETPSTARTNIADNWDKARVYNAKVEAWRGSLDGAGNVSGPKIKKLLNDEPVSGPMKEVGSVVAQYPELFRSTRLQTPQPGIIRRGAAAVAPMAGAGVGGALGGPGGAMVGEHVGRVVGGKLVGR